jgi:MFS superfamily sulfate permease-like transporter
LLIPNVLNLIPLSALAAVLIMTGYKLAKPSKLIEAYRGGPDFAMPFFITIAAIVATDLLTGIGIGLAIGAFFILKQHATSTGLRDVSLPGAILARYELEEQVTFLQRAGLVKKLESLPEGARIEIDGRHCKRIDPDVLAVLKEFSTSAVDRNIDYRLVGIKEAA